MGCRNLQSHAFCNNALSRCADAWVRLRCNATCGCQAVAPSPRRACRDLESRPFCLRVSRVTTGCEELPIRQQCNASCGGCRNHRGQPHEQARGRARADLADVLSAMSQVRMAPANGHPQAVSPTSDLVVYTVATGGQDAAAPNVPCAGPLRDWKGRVDFVLFVDEMSAPALALHHGQPGRESPWRVVVISNDSLPHVCRDKDPKLLPFYSEAQCLSRDIKLRPHRYLKVGTTQFFCLPHALDGSVHHLFSARRRSEVTRSHRCTWTPTHA